jgi:3'-phosphoadenosine 5'-phosphosulfate sulfotransferase (PAPS reductase)/FAD synthetase
MNDTDLCREDELDLYGDEAVAWPTFHVLNLGAGVQSTAVFLLSIRQDEPEHVPKFDYAVFADTQEEPRRVYEHIERLKKMEGAPTILFDTNGKLGDNLIHGSDATGKRFASIPMFLKVEGQEKEGRTRRQCTRDYKINPIERAIRRQILGLKHGQRADPTIDLFQYICLSVDEPRRVARTKERFAGTKWTSPRFPLFDMGWSRSDCKAYIDEVWPNAEVVRSSCVFCPYHSNEEWRDLKENDPEGWARAIEIDAAIRAPGSRCNQGLASTGYLHRSCVPLAEADIDEPQSNHDKYMNGFTQECEGMCGL